MHGNNVNNAKPYLTDRNKQDESLVVLVLTK